MDPNAHWGQVFRQQADVSGVERRAIPTRDIVGQLRADGVFRTRSPSMNAPNATNADQQSLAGRGSEKAIQWKSLDVSNFFPVSS